MHKWRDLYRVPESGFDLIGWKECPSQKKKDEKIWGSRICAESLRHKGIWGFFFFWSIIYVLVRGQTQAAQIESWEEGRLLKDFAVNKSIIFSLSNRKSQEAFRLVNEMMHLHFRKISAAVGWKGNGREGGCWPGNQPDDSWLNLGSLAKASPVRFSVLFSLKCGPGHFTIIVSLRNSYSSQTILFIF